MNIVFLLHIVTISLRLRITRLKGSQADWQRSQCKSLIKCKREPSRVDTNNHSITTISLEAI
jgi:hypothetical protein